MLRRSRWYPRGAGARIARAAALLLGMSACSAPDARSGDTANDVAASADASGPATGLTASAGGDDETTGAVVPVQSRATPAALGPSGELPADTAAPVPEMVLGEPDAVLDEEFSRIAPARELADGRLLVADRREIRLAVVDWATGRVTQIGREGRGPGEYRSAGRLHALAGDSSLFEDRRNGRWHLLVGDRITATVEYGQQHRRSLPDAAGVDDRGRVLVLHPYAYSQPRGGARIQYGLEYAESLLVLLEHRGTGARDTLLRLRGRSRGVNVVQKPPERGARKIPWYVGSPLAANDQPLLFPDGWLALARLAPYRVDWRDPAGRWTRGAPLPFDTVRVDARQQRFAVERIYVPEVEMRPDEMPDWPELLPAFLPDALLGAPDGRLLIQRTPHADRQESEYDVVERGGRLVARLTLPPKARIVAVGQRHLYVAVETDWFLQRLERHPWPARGSR